MSGPRYRGGGHLPPPDGAGTIRPETLPGILPPLFAGTPSPKQKIGSSTYLSAPDAGGAPARPRAAAALPRLAERALRTLPVVGPVTPANLHLPLWAMIVIGMGLTWLAAMVGHLAGARA